MKGLHIDYKAVLARLALAENRKASEMSTVEFTTLIAEVLNSIFDKSDKWYYSYQVSDSNEVMTLEALGVPVGFFDPSTFYYVNGVRPAELTFEVFSALAMQITNNLGATAHMSFEPPPQWILPSTIYDAYYVYFASQTWLNGTGGKRVYIFAHKK